MINSKNYFQKAAVILIALMLLSIPNLHVYSSVGSYQTISNAIKANTNYKQYLHSIEEQRLVAIFYHPTTCNILGISGDVVELIVNNVLSLNHNNVGDSSTSSDHALSLKTKTYTKYDFSGFDN